MITLLTSNIFITKDSCYDAVYFDITGKDNIFNSKRTLFQMVSNRITKDSIKPFKISYKK